MNVSHQSGRRYLVELDALEKYCHHVPQVTGTTLAVSLGPEEGGLEFAVLVGFELLARQYKAYHVLRQQGERDQGEYLVAVIIHELQYLDGGEIQAEICFISLIELA